MTGRPRRRRAAADRPPDPDGCRRPRPRTPTVSAAGRGLAALAMAAAALAGACGISTDEAARAIDPEDLPETLRPGFTAAPTTSVPAAPVAEPHTVYLLTDPPDIERTIVAQAKRPVAVGGTVADVLATLFGQTTTADEQAAGYFNTLELFELTGAAAADGVATIDFAPLSPEDNPPPADTLKLAAAQLVFTITEIDGINGVRLLLDGDEVSIPTSDADAEPGAVLRRDNYEQFGPVSLGA